MNSHDLPRAKHSTNEYGGWVMIVILFRLSQKPRDWAIERVTA